MHMSACYWFEVGRYGATAVLAGALWLSHQWGKRPAARRREAAQREASAARTREVIARYVSTRRPRG
jgi:hypothetical protein